MDRTVTGALSVLALAAACAGETPHASVEASYREAPLDGFVQIPRAGGQGTSSSARPTFDEVGMNQVSFFDIELRGGTAVGAVLAGFQDLRPGGSKVLLTDLVSQGATFPAGTPVTGALTLDWYRVALERRLELGAGFTIAPELGFSFVRFDWSLKGSGSESVSRGFSYGDVLLGALGSWRAGAFELRVRAFLAPQLPIRDQTTIYDVELTGRLQLGAFEPFVGVGFERLELRDTEQPLYNHLRVVLEPMVIAGLQLGF